MCPTSTVPENCEEAQRGCHTLTFKIKAVPVPDRTKTGNLCIHLLFFLDVVHLFRCDGELPLQPVHERAGDQSEGSHQHGHLQVGEELQNCLPGPGENIFASSGGGGYNNHRTCP